mgnify:CR=1 FL=1
MKYKAKKSYAELPPTDNFLSLGMASKHTFLIEGLEIAFNGTLPKGLEDHLSEVKEKKEVKEKGSK